MYISYPIHGHLAGGGGDGYREGVCVVTHGKQNCLNATRLNVFLLLQGVTLLLTPTMTRHTLGQKPPDDILLDTVRQRRSGVGLGAQARRQGFDEEQDYSVVGGHFSSCQHCLKINEPVHTSTCLHLASGPSP